MSKSVPLAVWLNTSQSFQRFAKSPIRYLSQQVAIAEWNYYQNEDEPSSLEIALVLLHDYLKQCNQPVHLIGHSTGGLLGLLYARKYPERVKSLTLLGVGVHPAVDWQAHYYTMRQLLPISQEIILAQMVQHLFGYQEKYSTKALVKLLKRDLNTSPSPHSLFQRVSIPPSGVPIPLMVCGSQDDLIVDSYSLQGWKDYFKEGDRLWEHPWGHHFFHYFYPQEVTRAIFKFWKSLPSLDFALPCYLQ